MSFGSHHSPNTEQLEENSFATAPINFPQHTVHSPCGFHQPGAWGWPEQQCVFQQNYEGQYSTTIQEHGGYYYQSPSSYNQQQQQQYHELRTSYNFQNHTVHTGVDSMNVQVLPNMLESTCSKSTFGEVGCSVSNRYQLPHQSEHHNPQQTIIGRNLHLFIHL